MMKSLKDNKKLIFIIILVFIVGGLTGVVAYSVYANKVTYDNTQSGLQSTDVQGAIDELYQKTQSAGIDSNSIDFATIQTNETKNVLASSKGVCVNINNKLNCFKINNPDIEKNHLQQVFSPINCSIYSSYVNCTVDHMLCSVNSNGRVGCEDGTEGSYCVVYPDGSVDCS